MTDFRELTSLRLGGPSDDLVRVTSEEELLEVECREDDLGDPVLVFSGGTNLVVADGGFRGTAVHVDTRGIDVEADGRGGARVTAAAGEPWDDLVAHAVDQGWSGVEALSGIPGAVGATPIQNVGAYGQEVADTITWVRCWDRGEQSLRTFPGSDCGFGYRTSRFKDEAQRYVVLSVTFQLRAADLGAPVRYAELASRLGVREGGQAPLEAVREAVLDLRRSKGMVLDPADHDTWSAGSFFTNPFLPPAQVPPGAPAYSQPDGRVKTSAAWLIEHAGFAKGFSADSGRVGLSTKHILALSNRGEGTTTELLELAVKVQSGVYAEFGVWLRPEPVLVGCTLPDAPSGG